MMRISPASPDASISLRDGRVVDDRMQASALDTRSVLDALPVAAMA